VDRLHPAAIGEAASASGHNPRTEAGQDRKIERNIDVRNIHAPYILALATVAGSLSIHAGENASNPLAAVNNIDVRAQYLDMDGNEVYDFWVADGAFMVSPKLKLKYELHYWHSDLSGSNESDWESLHLKPIYFPLEGELGTWKYRLAVGVEWILDFGNDDQGIGSGSDQIAPLAGVAFMPGDRGTVLIPLVQHFVDYDGPDVNQTAFRLIAIQPLPKRFWTKLDAKVPVDWEHDNDIPASFEVQLGKMFTPSFGVYTDGLVGIGSERPYDWGVGVGVRLNF